MSLSVTPSDSLSVTLTDSPSDRIATVLASRSTVAALRVASISDSISTTTSIRTKRQRLTKRRVVPSDRPKPARNFDGKGDTPPPSARATISAPSLQRFAEVRSPPESLVTATNAVTAPAHANARGRPAPQKFVARSTRDCCSNIRIRGELFAFDSLRWRSRQVLPRFVTPARRLGAA